MDPFAQAIESWHDFYILIGTAAATLLGLLFVGLSINLENFRRYEDMRALAGQTLTNFLYTLGVAAILLIPNQSPLGVALPLIGFGASGVAVTLRQSRVSRQSKTHIFGRTIILRFQWPLICFVGMILVGIGLARSYTDGLYWLVGIILILILGASRNAWDLLVGTPAMEETQTPPS